MKCHDHDVDATAICMQCGKAICANCMKTTPTGRTVCSDSCSFAITRQDAVIRSLALKTNRQMRAAAVSMFIIAAASVLFGIFAYFTFGYFLAVFLIFMGLASAAAGSVYLKKDRETND